MQWFVFYVQGRKEQALCREFNKYEELVAFVPLMERKQKKQGVAYITEQILFPGYIFVKTEKDQGFMEAICRDSKRKTSGIRKLLKYDEEGTSPLREEEQTFLEKILDENYVVRMSKGIIIQGMTHVQEGPLQGLEKYIKKIDRHKCLANLYVEVLGKEILVGLEITSKS